MIQVRFEKLLPVILFHHLELLQRTFQQSDRRLQGVISKTMVFDILARLEISISESVLADIIRLDQENCGQTIIFLSICEVSPGLISWIQVIKLLKHAENGITKENSSPTTPVSVRVLESFQRNSKQYYVQLIKC